MIYFVIQLEVLFLINKDLGFLSFLFNYNITKKKRN